MMNSLSMLDMPQSPPTMNSVGMASSYRIRRHGARPLVFAGTELAMAMSFTPGLPYWYEINVYRTDDQRFVLAIRLFFASEEEKDVVDAWSFSTLPELFDALEAYDAGRDVQVPAALAGKTHSAAELAAGALEIRARVAAARQHFASLVGELFSEIEAAGGSAA